MQGNTAQSLSAFTELLSILLCMLSQALALFIMISMLAGFGVIILLVIVIIKVRAYLREGR